MGPVVAQPGPQDCGRHREPHDHSGAEWRTFGLFSAADEGELRRVLASMPPHVWRTDTITPFTPHPSDPGTAPASVPLFIATQLVGGAVAVVGRRVRRG